MLPEWPVVLQPDAKAVMPSMIAINQALGLLVSDFVRMENL